MESIKYRRIFALSNKHKHTNFQTNKNLHKMAYSKKFQSKKVLTAKVTQIVEAAMYNELNTEKEGIEILYNGSEEDGVEGVEGVEGVTFTYANASGVKVSATFKRVNNMDATYNEQYEEMNDDATFEFMAFNQDYKNLSDFSIHHIVSVMLKRYAK